MDLIKKLNAHETLKYRQGLFYCPTCKKDVIKNIFTGASQKTCSFECSKINKKKPNKPVKQETGARFVKFYNDRVKN